MSQFFEYTSSGIRFKGFQDIRATLVSAWKATFGEALDTDPTSPDGHHIDLETATVNSVAEMIQAVCTTMNREQATGQYLDLLAAFLGLQRNDGETDAELRARMDVADRSGMATYDGMLTYLRNHLGNSVNMAVNDEPTTDSDGIPGHHFRVTVSNAAYSAIEALVESGEIADADDYIAQLIWNCKAAGITGDGNKTGHAKDLVGMKHDVKFSLPENIGIDVSVTISLYAEEAFPTEGIQMVRDAIIGWAAGTGSWAKAEYVPGKDVIPERLYTPIMTVPGIASAVIKVRKSSETDWETTPISITSQEMAVISTVAVEVDS